MRTFICYLASVAGAGAIGGLVLGMQTLWGVLQLWLWLSVALAAFPLFTLSMVVYLGGFYGAWKTIFGESEVAASKDA